MPSHLIAEEGPLRGRLLDLEQGEEWIIGRDPEESDFVLEDPAVSRRAARLVRGSEGIFIENLSRTNPVLLNDHPCQEPTLLKEADRIQIGQTIFLFSEENIAKSEPSDQAKGGYDDIFGSLEEDLTPVETEPETPKKAEKKKKEEKNPYDTIFEDSETGDQEIDLPFTLLSETPFVLKVVSGPNAGAEIGMEKGRSYTLGKDPDSCDIVFQDLSVSRTHARIDVDSEGLIEIEDLGSKNGTVINGVASKVKQPLTTQDIVSLGTTAFLIIDREAPQETIYSPLPMAYEAPKKEEPPPPPPAEVEILEQPEEPKRDWKKEPIPGKYLAAAAAFAAMFLIVFLSFFSLFKSEEVEVAQKEPSGKIQKALAKFEGVQFSFNPASGKLFLVGHVLTAVDAQEMRFRIQEMQFIQSVEDNVVIDEYVDKQMNDILSQTPDFRGVAIHSAQPGRFSAVGFIETNASATLLADYLAVNFPYLDRLENKVVVIENLTTQIQSLILSKGFGSIAFQYANGEVVLSGNYSNKKTDLFKSLLKELNQVKGVAGVKNYAMASSPSQAAIDLSAQYQVSGIAQYEGKGYSAIVNGKLYTLGDDVNGMAITDIDPAMILLEKEGIKYKINYTR